MSMADGQGQAEGGKTISFAHKLAESPRFKALFRDGMSLVEEVAAYLDGPGRDEAKLLPRTASLAYAAESMRLTTRLMQAASWLLVQRAVNEGEITQKQAETEKHRVRLSTQTLTSADGAFEQLPSRLRDLTARSLRLQTRILYLDQSIREPAVPCAPPAAMPRAIDLQMERIRAAFRYGRL